MPLRLSALSYVEFPHNIFPILILNIYDCTKYNCRNYIVEMLFSSGEVQSSLWKRTVQRYTDLLKIKKHNIWRWLPKSKILLWILCWNCRIHHQWALWCSKVGILQDLMYVPNYFNSGGFLYFEYICERSWSLL